MPSNQLLSGVSIVALDPRDRPHPSLVLRLADGAQTGQMAGHDAPHAMRCVRCPAWLSIGEEMQPLQHALLRAGLP